MRLLLDTHIWLWSSEQPERIPASVRSVLSNLANEIWLSPISIWEFDLLRSKGRLEANQSIEDWVHASLQNLAWRDAPITAEVALENACNNFPHKDPADRWLVATARVHQLTLVTADQTLLQLKPCALLPVRPRRPA